MGFRRRQPTVTGGDYLTVVAADAIDTDVPFADEFATMLDLTFGPNDHSFLEVVAKRPLKDYEAGPTSIVLAAARAAIARGDADGLAEVLQVGLALLAKWPHFLIGRELHRDLDYRER
jgi:hypothetical protein